MKTLELNQLKYYLGTGMECHVNGEFVNGTEFDDKPILKELEIVGISYDFIECHEKNSTVTEQYALNDLHLFMFPISAITEPVLDGWKVPIVELAKIAYPKTRIVNVDKFNRVDIGAGYSFGYSEKEQSFDCKVGFNGKTWYYECFVNNQLALFEQLFQWHIWPFDQSLFESGVLIDKRTVK